MILAGAVMFADGEAAAGEAIVDGEAVGIGGDCEIGLLEDVRESGAAGTSGIMVS